MNPVSSLVFKWYVFLTLLAIFASISINFLSLFSGILLAWFVFILFFIGANKTISFSRNKFSYIAASSSIVDCKLYPMSVISVLAIFASIYAAKFYTGKSFFEVFAALALDVSLYNEYQKYFAQQGLSALSIAKIPAILSMLYLKVVVVYSYISIFILRKKIALSNVFWLLIISLSSLYFSLARGTSFEFFELLLLFWFCLSMRTIRYSLSQSIFSSQKVTLVIVGILALALYSYNISARYAFGEVAECVTNEICLTNDTMLFYFSAPIAQLTLKLSGYFTFGIYYTSTLLNYFWLDNFSNFIQLSIPFASYYDETITQDFLCDVLLNCRAAWVPDVALYINKVGLLGIFFGAYIVGRVVRGITLVAFSSNDLITYAILYLAFLAMVSLPVGNFLTISSANIMLLILVVSIYAYRKILRKL